MHLTYPQAQRFLTGLNEDPFNESLRLIYADWLNQHGFTTAAKKQLVYVEMIRYRTSNVRCPKGMFWYKHKLYLITKTQKLTSFNKTKKTRQGTQKSEIKVIRTRQRKRCQQTYAQATSLREAYRNDVTRSL